MKYKINLILRYTQTYVIMYNYAKILLGITTAQKSIDYLLESLGMVSFILASMKEGSAM